MPSEVTERLLTLTPYTKDQLEAVSDAIAEIERLRAIVDELGGLFRSIADTLPVDGTPTVQHARRLALDAIAEARDARKAGG